MGYYDLNNALLNIAGAKQKKKEFRWSQLKDIAGLGMDVWRKLSAVPEAKEMADYENTLAAGRASTSQGYAKEQFGWEAGEAEKDRTWQAGQREADRSLQRNLEASRASREMGDRKERRQSFLAEWTQRAYELAVSNPSFLTPEGQFDPEKKEALRSFLYSQVDKLPMLEQAEIDWAKASFDGFVNGLGAAGQAPMASSAPVFNAPQTFKDVSSNAQSLLGVLKQAPDLTQQEKVELGQIAPALQGAVMGTGLDSESMSYVLQRLQALYDAYNKRKQGGVVPNLQRTYEVNPAARKR